MTVVCRTCHIATLDDDELARFVSEPLTSPVHLCPEHQESWDALVARIRDVPFTRLDFGAKRFA